METTKKRTINDRCPNFRDERGQLFLIRCFACEPQRGVENWAVAVSSGACAFCGWSDKEAQEQMCHKRGCQNPWCGCGPDPRQKKTPMSSDEAAIIAGAVENALCWGTGLLTTAREALEDAGYTWTFQHEHYIFENFVEAAGRLRSK